MMLGEEGLAPLIPELPVPLQEVTALSASGGSDEGGRITGNYCFITVQQ